MQVAQGKEGKIGGACDTHEKAKMNTKTLLEVPEVITPERHRHRQNLEKMHLRIWTAFI
jgi:hypothetical protein